MDIYFIFPEINPYLYRRLDDDDLKKRRDVENHHLTVLYQPH